MKWVFRALTVLLVTAGILVPVVAGSVSDQPSRTATPKAKQRLQVRQLADSLEARSVMTDFRLPVREISAPLDKPDLCLQDLWLGAGPSYPENATRIIRNVAPGDTIYLVCYLSNQGGRIAQQWWKTGYYIDGVLAYATDDRDINTGGRSYGVAKVVAPEAEGVHYFECRLDYENSIPESDERNNRKEIPFRVGPSVVASGDLPDLIVSDIRLDGTNIEIWIQNVGGGVVKPLSLQAYMNGNLMGPEIAIDDTRLYLGTGDYAHFTQFYWTVGVNYEYLIRAVVDPSNRVAESNEENNEMTVKIIRR